VLPGSVKVYPPNGHKRMGGDDVEPELSRMLDKLEIREVLTRWCRGIDRGDVELMASTYHPDALDEHGPFVYSGEEAARKYIARHKRDYKRHFHTTVSETIELDGDVARCESYWIVYVIADDEEVATGEAVQNFWGRYLDRFERRGGPWKIAERRMVLEGFAKMSSVPVFGEPGGVDSYLGARSVEDPSYAWFE
jgi:ketosteroid isomerase-like protein